MDQHSGHLSDAEIEQYGSTVSATGPKAEDRLDAQPLDAQDLDVQTLEGHLADCQWCRNRLLLSQRARLALLTDSPMNTAPYTGSSGPHPRGPDDRGPDCPHEDDLRDLAAGLCPPDQGAKLTQHAAQCDHCGPLLRIYTEDFSDELTKEDETLLGKLKSASAGWQRKLAREMVAGSGGSTSKTERKSLSWRWVLAPTAVAACAAIAFAVWYSQRETPERVEKLLAQAYAENRSLEMRVPYAKHADYHQQRGGESSLLTLPESYRNAGDQIASHLKKNPDDPQWLLLSARFDLLDWRYKAALATLDKIEDDKVRDSLEMLVTRALAFYEKAESEPEDKQSYGKAVDLLGKVLQKSPDDPVALFNQAVACEKIHAYECASADYQHLLNTDKDSGWAAEAQERLNIIKGKKNSRAISLKRLNLEVAWDRLSGGQSVTHLEDESYLGIALENWVLQPNRPSGVSLRLEQLAESLYTNHRDVWLFDFLHSQPSKRANKLLLEGIQANYAGDADRALRAAIRAETAYLRHGNEAGALRSVFEEIYALRRLSKPAECVRRASHASRLSSLLHYTWIDNQATIEQGNCEGMRGRADTASALAGTAIKKAIAAGYPNLEMRALGLRGNLDVIEGRRDASWTGGEDALNRFWQGAYPDDRGFQLYYNLQVDSEKSGAIYLALALQRETLKMIAGRARFDFEAMAHFRMAGAAQSVGDYDTARREVDLYKELISRLSASSARDVYEAYCEIGLARLAVEGGSGEEALKHLNNATPVLSNTENSMLRMEYLKTWADLDRLSQDTSAEQRHLTGITSIANRGFHSLRSVTDRWRWRQVVDGAYRRLLEIELASPHSSNHALGDLEFYHQLETSPTLPSTDPFELVEPANIERRTKARISKLHATTLVAFAVLPGTVAAWVSDDRGTREFVLRVSPSQLRDEVRRFYFLCSDPLSPIEKVNASGSRLYEWLIIPLEPSLDPTRTWAFEPDGVLSLIPWSALRMPNGEYMGQVRTLTTNPGLFTGSLRTRGRHVADKVLVAIPGSVEVDGRIFPPLPEAEEEADNLARLYRNTKRLGGSAVTVPSILQQLPGTDVLDFAGHALSREHGGELLVHSEYGTATLSASMLSGLNLKNVQLAVLAACSTAAERDADRDPNGLVRAFLNAGVEQVVASRWDIDSRSTTELMKEFYRSFKARMSGPQALKAARWELSSRDQFSHPYYWAGIEIFTSN